MAVEWIWLGPQTHNSIRIKAKVTGAGTARLLLSETATRTNPFYTPYVTPDTVGSVRIADFPVTGLLPGKRYFAFVEDSGTLSTIRWGEFKTWPAAPGSPVSYRIGAWTCAGSAPDYVGPEPYTSNHPALGYLSEEFKPDLTVIGGDLHYLNNTTASVTPYRGAFEACLNPTASSNMSRAFRHVPTSYTWDDHDFGPNDADSTDPGRTYVAQAYREYVPHETLVESGAIYRSQQIGRVLHVYMDTRYYRSPNMDMEGPLKTMLGATQIAWFENLLATTTAEMLSWYMPTQWLGVGSDCWSSFTLERDRLVEILKAPAGDPSKDWTKRMFMVTGDVHAIAIDDGTGNPWGEFPSYVMASIDSAGNNNETNRYKVKGEFVPASAGRGRFGVIDIDDDGDRIKVDAKCYIGRWKRFQHEWELRTSPEAIVGAEIPGDVEAFADIDWRSGTYFGNVTDTPEGFQTQSITDWKISRQLATDIPDDMRISAGLSTAQAEVQVAAPSGATIGHWSPFRTPVQYLQAPVELSVEADGERYGQFVGTTEEAGSDNKGVELKISALDPMVDLDQPITIPAFSGQMGTGFNPGISTGWVVEHALMQFDRGALWGPGPKPIIYASMAGSTMANIGTWANSTSSQDANSAPEFIKTTDLPYTVPQTYGSRMVTGNSADDSLTSSTGWTVGAITGDAPRTIEGRCNIDMKISSINDGRFITFESVVTTIGHQLNVRTKTNAGVTIDTYAVKLQLGPWWVTLTPETFGYRVQLYQTPSSFASVYLSMSTATTTVGAEHKLAWVDIYGFDSAVQGIQVLEGSSYTEADLPKYDPTRAKISLPTTTLVGTPAIDNPTGKSVLQSLADAEQGAMWFDEEGKAVFESRGDLRGVGKEVIPTRSDVSLVSSGSWTTSLDQLRSRVDVPVMVPAYKINPAGWQQVWDASSVIEVKPYETLDIIVNLPAPAGGFAETLWAGNAGSGGSWFNINRARKGTGTQMSPSTFNSGRVSAISATQARVVWRNPYSTTMFLVNSAGEPSLHIGARWTVEKGDSLIVSRSTGQSGTVLSVGENPWRQDLVDATLLAQYLADETKAPRPYLNDVEIAFDPRIKLASVISLQDPDYLGAEIKCLVRGVELASKDGTVTQRLSVQPLRLTLGEVDLAWHGSTLQDIDDAWAQFLTFSSVTVEPNTLQAFDNDPLKGAPNAGY